ncbi:MAG: hypothetical protein HY779_05385, partial [Rubrobacteridae bacterium]|nr:hypothetical protein [Rubrobacteridae bacterium]
MSFKVLRIFVVVVMIMIVGAAFYGLANGTIFQHRAEGTGGGGECNGECSECEEINPVSVQTAKDSLP